MAKSKYEIEIRVPLEYINSPEFHCQSIARKLNVGAIDLPKLKLIRRSLDARKTPPVYVLKFALVDKSEKPETFELSLKEVSKEAPVIIVGFGPAGMFAALRLIELGLKPVILEQGKSVRERRHDIAAICKKGIVNPQSNYCFGEGGAGTFSDGKLYTRSNKRGSIERILNILINHGANPDILIDAHPHIGTNLLPKVVQEIRKTIIAHGGEVHFNSKVTGIHRDSSGFRYVTLADGQKIQSKALIIATGHSARDIFSILDNEKFLLEAKAFAVGVRIEHPQELINQMQYRNHKLNEQLPPASYSLVAQCNGRGVFSFCMCPGGIICPAATSNDEIVVNGWSPSKRNSAFANSGIVVEVKDEDLLPHKKHGALAGIEFQKLLEQNAFRSGGGKQVAPAVRLTDFLAGKISQSLPNSSYLPGITSANFTEIFPSEIFQRLKLGFEAFGNNRRGFISSEAVLVATESRTSSPVRIPRDRNTFMHPDVPGLFPSGEGAGYAGGIMSAAMDGENVADAVAEFHYL